MVDTVKVMVVDDSSFMRKVLMDTLSTDPEIEVVGVANNGQQCVDIFKNNQPDVILLDVAMPIMDGITALKHVMVRKPVPIVILSSLTYESKVIFEALRLGAIDFVPKPSGAVSENIQEIKKDLINVIKKAKRVNIEGIRRVKFDGLIDQKAKANQYDSRPKAIKQCIVMAGTLGSPNSFLRIISSLVPAKEYVVIALLNMAAPILSGFVEEVNSFSEFDVLVAKEGLVVNGGQIIVDTLENSYVLMRNKSGVVEIVMNPALKENRAQPIDDLLISTSRIFQSNMIGILLTGDTAQGELGFREISAAGGITIAQEQSSCYFSDLPDFVIGKGLVDKIAPDQNIAEELCKILKERK